MSIMTMPGTGIFQVPPYPIRKFTVEEYHRLIETGVLTEDDPVELLEGWIVQKMPRNPAHDGTIALVQDGIHNHLPPGWHVRGQSAITTRDSEPEPDLAIVRGPFRIYMDHHPGPQDIALVIEVADSSLERDRKDKGRIYARAGIPVYWIINLVDAKVEVYFDPSGTEAVPSYRQRKDYGRDESVPLMIEGREVGQINVRELLPS